MELPSRIVKQNGEIVQAARGFKRCDVTLIPNGAVIVRFYEQRLSVCWKSRAIYTNPFSFGAHYCPSKGEQLNAILLLFVCFIILCGFSEVKFRKKFKMTLQRVVMKRGDLEIYYPVIAAVTAPALTFAPPAFFGAYSKNWPLPRSMVRGPSPTLKIVFSPRRVIV
jgi:hypothetical protein